MIFESNLFTYFQIHLIILMFLYFYNYCAMLGLLQVFPLSSLLIHDWDFYALAYSIMKHHYLSFVLL